MAQKLHTIAVLADNNAYGSIVEMVLADNNQWRVRLFSTGQELEAYASIVDIDVLVCDLDFEHNNAAYMLRVITRLRLTTRSVKRVIVTTRSLLNWSYPQSIGAGVDEVLIKPMSPVYLSERVAAHVEIGAEKRDLQDILEQNQTSIDELVTRIPGETKPSAITASTNNVVDFSSFAKSRQSHVTPHVDA